MREIENNIKQFIDESQFFELKSILNELEPIEVEELLNDLPQTDWIIVFRLLTKDLAADVFTELEPDEQAKLIEEFREFRVRDIILELDPDDRTELFEKLPTDVVRRLIEYLPLSEKKQALELLGYPEDSVGREMTTEFVELNENWTVEQALLHVRKTAPDKETIYTAYVIGPKKKLIGVISLRDLLLANDDEIVTNIMNPHVITVKTSDHRELAAREMINYNFISLPVVDSEDRLVGIVTVDDVLEVLEEEFTEDVERMAAVEPTEKPYLSSSVWNLVRSRVVWLALLLILEGLTTSIMGHFEEMIAGMVFLTFFVPTLVGVGGNTGSQIAAMVIRGLSIGELTNKDIMRIIGKEALVGLVLAIILAILLFFRALILKPQTDIAIAIAVALGIVVWFSNISGALLPLAAKKLV
ncbi:magnesium transporter [bacterium]|nr:magnesium transporter [bacterium]